MTLQWQQHWAEMEFGCRQILHYTQPMSEAALCQNEMALEAVLYNLERICQAARNLPEDAHSRLKKTDQHTLANIKEVAANAQFDHDLRGLWTLINEQIPALLTTLVKANKKESYTEQPPRLHHRGRNVVRPWQLPPLGWKDISWRVLEQFSKNNLSIVAAGVAFYGLLAIVPALATLVSIYGLMLNPADVGSQLASLKDIFPKEAWSLLRNQLHTLASQSGAALSFSALIGILLALWGARIGTGALMSALNIVYGEEEKRSLIQFNITALVLTLGGILFGVAALGMIVVLPTLLGYISADLGIIAKAAFIWLRWPLLTAAIMFVLTILYRFGPSRRPARWPWLSIGAVAAALLWILVSIVFSFYVAHFGSYNKTYGSLGAVVILMLWFWLTALAVLIGGGLNAEMEHQTKEDTTVGGSKPMGKRNAYMADTLGRRT